VTGPAPRPTPRTPPKPRPGDRVAVVSPSSGLPGLFARPFELGLERLRDAFGLVPVEYPTTRRMGSRPVDRAADVNAAFADPTIAAVLSSIGGDDEVSILRHLDRDLIAANPKPFFGYSDNTALLAYLWGCGIVGYHGASVMVQLGRPGAVHPFTERSFRAALFTTGPFELPQPDASGDVDRPWSDPATFDSEPVLEPCDPWRWPAVERIVEGPAWGGNLEVLSWLAMADLAIGPPAEYEGSVLLLETSEEMPGAIEVERILRGLGERGLLGPFAAVLVGRPKASNLERPLRADEKAAFRRDQRAAVQRGFDEYGSSPLIVYDVDFGHTDPQLVIPIGGSVRVDGRARRIVVTY
jgi:muramoyltetrapeptide carboxypeptidase LdcA involved in peptidoglycan recycling